MNRGASPYSLRGTALVVPNGTIANPGVRFGRGRTGFYRLRTGVAGVVAADDGSVGFAMGAFEVLKLGLAQTVIKSNDPSTASIPLRLTRGSISVADGQEVDMEFWDFGTTAARFGAYRATLAEYGFKWYSRDHAGMPALPSMTLTNTKMLSVAGPIIAGDQISSRPTASTVDAMLGAQNTQPNRNAIVQLYTNSGAQGLELRLQGGAAGYGLGTGIGAGSLYTTSNAPLILGTNNVARLSFLGNGDGTVRLGPGNFTWLRADASMAASIGNLGLQISVPAPADPLAGLNWQTMPIVITAIGGTTPGITFHRPGLAAPVLYEQGGLPYWSGQKMWTDANNAGAGTIPGSAIQTHTITATQIAPGAAAASLEPNSVVTGQLAQNAIHGGIFIVGGPPSDFQFTANGSVWSAIPGLTTGNFNPINGTRYETWVDVSVAHSAGGRVILRVVNVRLDNGAVQEIGRGVWCGGGEPGLTTWPAPSWFKASMHTVWSNPLGPTGIFVTSQFRVEILSADVGEVRVFANNGQFHFWEVKR